MVYGGTIYFLFYFHTEETAAARGVGQQFLLVAGADEGGNAWQLAIIGDILQMLPPTNRREGRATDDCHRNLLSLAEKISSCLARKQCQPNGQDTSSYRSKTYPYPTRKCLPGSTGVKR